MSITMNLQDHVSVQEAADTLQITYKALLMRISRGRVKARRWNGRILLIERAELERIKLAENNKTARATQ